jgi:hypothetical protein
MEPVVVTSSSSKIVVQFNTCDKSSIQNFHFRFFCFSEWFKCRWKTVYFFFEARFNIGIQSSFASDFARSWDWLYHLS